MTSFKEFLLKLLSFFSWRIVGYLIAFLNTILVTSIFGVENLGVYSFFILLIGFSKYIFLGGPDLYIVEGSKYNLGNKKLINKYFIYSLSIAYLGVLISFLLIYFLGITESELLRKYKINEFIPFLFLLFLTRGLSASFMSMDRLHGGTIGLSLFYVIPYLLDFIILINIKEFSIFYFLVSGLTSHLLLAIIFFLSIRKKRKSLAISYSENKGFMSITRYLYLSISLAISSLSYYGFFLFIRTIASLKLSVESFGILSFGWLLAQSTQNIISSINLLAYPRSLRLVNNFLNSNNHVDEFEAKSQGRLLFSLSSLGWVLSIVFFLLASKIYPQEILLSNLEVFVLYACGSLLFDSIFISTAYLQVARKQMILAVSTVPIYIYIWISIGSSKFSKEPIDFALLLLSSLILYCIGVILLNYFFLNKKKRNLGLYFPLWEEMIFIVFFFFFFIYFDMLYSIYLFLIISTIFVVRKKSQIAKLL